MQNIISNYLKTIINNYIKQEKYGFNIDPLIY